MGFIKNLGILRDDPLGEIKLIKIGMKNSPERKIFDIITDSLKNEKIVKTLKRYINKIPSNALDIYEKKYIEANRLKNYDLYQAMRTEQEVYFNGAYIALHFPSNRKLVELIYDHYNIDF